MRVKCRGPMAVLRRTGVKADPWGSCMFPGRSSVGWTARVPRRGAMRSQPKHPDKGLYLEEAQ
jgi:hypothetical protein